jgi:ribosomal protein S14
MKRPVRKVRPRSICRGCALPRKVDRKFGLCARCRKFNAITQNWI